MDNSNTNNENKKSQAVNKPAEILKATLILALCTIALLGLYLISTSPLIAGKPYELETSGYTIQPGKTTVAELTEAGFSFSDYSSNYKEIYDVNTMAASKTKYQLVSLLKEGKLLADVTIINESSTSKPLLNCLISEVTLNLEKPYDDMDKVYLKGISLTDLTPDKLSEVMGKNSTAADYKSYLDTSPTGTSYIWSKGKYALEIVISTDGNLMSIKSNYNK